MDLHSQVEEMKKEGWPVHKGSPRLHINKSKDHSNKNVFENWILRWAKYATMNYPYVSKSWGVKLLQKCAINVPAVIVGIGPSLELNIEHLKMVQGRGLLFAVDAVARRLIKEGITPDIVVSLDAKKGQYSVWEGIDTSEIPLFISTFSHPDNYLQWKGPVLFFNAYQDDNFYTGNVIPYLYPQVGCVDAAGTVGNMAILIADGMGCDPIIMAGMDFCYQPYEPDQTDQYRCRDFYKEGDQWIETTNPLYKLEERLGSSSIEEIKGKKYRTDDPLKDYRRCILEHIGTKNMVVINCSPGGILQEFMPTQKLDYMLMKNFNSELAKGRTIIPHLKYIAPKPNVEDKSDRQETKIRPYKTIYTP